MTTIFARAAAGDVIWLDATVDRIAAILALRGDPDSVDVRRSKALGIIALPARAVLLLAEYEDTTLDFDEESIDTGAEAGPDAAAEGPDCSDSSGRDGSGADEGPIADLDLAPAEREVSPREARDLQHAALVREHLRSLAPADLLPPVTVDLHLHADTLAGHPGAVRFEDVGAVTLQQLKVLLGTGCQVRVQPVIDLNAEASVDAYEAPEAIRDALRLRSPADVFRCGASLSRRMDFDHTVPYRPPGDGGPPGQTRVSNAGFLSRRTHRIRTHGRWQLRQPEPGSYLWRSPYGWFWLVNATGTHALGRERFAQRIWHAAQEAPVGETASRSTRTEMPPAWRGSAG